MSGFTINMNNSNFKGPIQIGDHNTMNLNSHINDFTEEQWDEIKKFLSERRNDFSYNSEEYGLICEAECLAGKKDQTKLKNLITKKKDIFINSVLSTVAAASVKGLIEWIL